MVSINLGPSQTIHVCFNAAEAADYLAPAPDGPSPILASPPGSAAGLDGRQTVDAAKIPRFVRLSRLGRSRIRTSGVVAVGACLGRPQRALPADGIERGASIPCYSYSFSVVLCRHVVRWIPGGPAALCVLQQQCSASNLARFTNFHV